MQIFLSNQDLDRLKLLASQMGVPINYHHSHHTFNLDALDDNPQAVQSDTWLVDMFEEIDKRLRTLEEKSGLLY